MKTHNDFNIRLHENSELADIHGAKVVLREPLHGWPLSVVERVAFGDGASRVYKAYRNLPAEIEFYKTIHSPNIPKLFYAQSEGNQHWLLLEDVKGRHPAVQSREELLGLARRARGIINEFGSAMPHRYDLSEKGYDSFVLSVTELLTKLRREEKLKAVSEEAVARIEKALSHTEVRRTVHGKCVLLHGDLKCDNILIRSDGSLVIIDWQSLLFGPEDTDVYYMLAAQGADPVSIAGIGPEILRLALAIKWFADCADLWLPFSAGFYDKQITKIEKQIQYIIGNN